MFLKTFFLNTTLTCFQKNFFYIFHSLNFFKVLIRGIYFCNKIKNFFFENIIEVNDDNKKIFFFLKTYFHRCQKKLDKKKKF
jgi:hypothetical protein